MNRGLNLTVPSRDRDGPSGAAYAEAQHGRGSRNAWRSVRFSFAVLLLGMALAGCSFQRLAVDIVGDAITGDGTTFAGDDDPELIREALPFGLKTYESMLEVSPEHRGLLRASAKGFTVYAYLIQTRADILPQTRLAEARKMYARASKLYVRGRDYALRGLEAEHPGFKALFATDRAKALAQTTREDVPFLYWAGAAWGGALSASKDDLNLVAELPAAGALVGRVLTLDEGYELGAAHEFFISYEAGRPGGSIKKAREHYRKALELSHGRRASIHVSLAEAVSAPEQNLKEFKSLLAKAEAHDVNAYLPLRLSNVLARDRARWLESRIPDLFVDASMAEVAK